MNEERTYPFVCWKDLDVGDLEVRRVVVGRRLDEVEAVTGARLVEYVEGEIAADGDVLKEIFKGENVNDIPTRNHMNALDERLRLNEFLPIARRCRIVRGRKGPRIRVRSVCREITRDGRALEETTC